MPTSNPRVNVTLSPSLDTLVQRLATLQGVSKSHVLRELVETAEPGLQRVVALMDAANAAGQEMRNTLRRSLGEAVGGAEVAMHKALRGLDTATADLVAQAEAVRGRRPGRGGAAARPVVVPRDPPASNRGVKSRKAGQSVGRVRGRK